MSTEYPSNLYGVQHPNEVTLNGFLNYKHEIELKLIEKENLFKQRRRYFEEMLDDEESSIKLKAVTTLASLEKFKHKLEHEENIN
ncbi:hypothetical protein C6P42_001798 [Pichia californica]|nr:hypothetical protein C6P42_001798 [[Candida] californica]